MMRITKLSTMIRSERMHALTGSPRCIIEKCVIDNTYKRVYI